MEYFYRSKELWDILGLVQNEMIRRNDDEDPIRQLVTDTVISTITRIKCEISYRGFQGVLVSEEDVWKKVEDAKKAADDKHVNIGGVDMMLLKKEAEE